jgi:hypothetical protein
MICLYVRKRDKRENRDMKRETEKKELKAKERKKRRKIIGFHYSTARKQRNRMNRA